MTEEKYHLSFGGGVNSTAILVLIEQGKLSYPNLRIVFADTGCERPSTYCHIQEMQKHFNIEVVRNEKWANLYEYYWKYRIVPSRMFRACTREFKIKPISEWEKKNNYEKATAIIGFCKGEQRRANKRYGIEHEEYPLIDLGIDREGCKKLIREHGWKVPERSGCFICPFQRKLTWLALKQNNPDLFQKAVSLEKNAKSGGCIMEKDLHLEDWIKEQEKQERLMDFEDYQHCLCAIDNDASDAPRPVVSDGKGGASRRTNHA